MQASNRLPDKNLRYIRTQDKVCHHWLQGKCRFGSTCKFRHGPEERERLKTSDVGRSEPGNLPLNNGPFNKDLNVDKRNDDVSLLQIQSSSSNLPSVSPGMRDTKVCRDWKSGRCSRGEKCRFSHVGPLKVDGTATQPDENTNIEKAGPEEEQEIKRRFPRQARSNRQAGAEDERNGEARRLMRDEQVAQEKRAKEALEEQMRVERERRREEEMRVKEENVKIAEDAKKKRQMEMQARREQDARVVERYPILDSTLVSFGAGLEIRNIVAGFDLCTMRLKNLPMDAKLEEIEDLFLQQGITKLDFFVLQVKADSNKREATVLINSEHGNVLTPGLDGIPFRDEYLSLTVDVNTIGTSMDTTAHNAPFMLVSWKIPSDTIVAGYCSMEEARIMAHKLNMTTWKGRQIRAVMNERPQGVAGLRNFNPASVKIMNLPLTGFVPADLHQFTGTMDHKLLKSSSFNIEESHTRIKALVGKLPGVLEHSYEVVNVGTTDSSGEAKIKVYFEEWEDAKNAHTVISQLEGGQHKPTFKPWLPPKPLRYTIKIPAQQYEAQKRQWDELSTAKVGGDAYVQARPGNRGDIFIRVLGQDKKAVGQLKVRVESMVSGERLGQEYWHTSWMNNSARTFFNRVFNDKKVFIRNDFKSRTLRVYGEPHLVAEVRPMIKQEVDSLAQRETTRSLNRASVGFFVREGLGKLVELLGEDNVVLNLASRPCRITVKGGDEAYHHLQRMLDECNGARSFSCIANAEEEKEACPICMDEISHPEHLVCGHTYCAGCLKHFLTSAIDAKTFPLVCMGNDATCNVPFPIPFMQRFLPEGAFRALVEAALVHHLDQHPQEWKYCTTPDCKQIYRRRSIQAVLQCPSCFSTICPACDKEAHEGMTCEERRILKDPAEQQRLTDELAKKFGYKNCPQCNVLIEKTEGCNHMTCKCGAHICWRCMAVSDDKGPFNGNSIYVHMNNVHGNIYEQVPAGIDLGNVQNRDFVAEQADELARIERERLGAQHGARGFQERDVDGLFVVRAGLAQPQWQNVNNRLVDEDGRRRLEQYERMRLVEGRVEQYERRRLVEEENRRRLVAEENRRNQRLVEEETRRRAIAFQQRMIQERREAEERLARERATQQRRDAEDRSWCVVM